MAKIRWGTAFLLFMLIAFAHYYPTTTITSWIVGVVSSTQDFSSVRQFVIRDSAIVLPVFDDGQATIKNFKDITERNDGFTLVYNRPITIFAATNGVVIFSAHRASAEKAVIVAYDNGITTHYENVTTIEQLPYTAVKKGEQLATVENGELHLSLYKDGVALNERQVIRWLYEQF